VLTEKLADLYTAEGKPSSAILTYQIALKLKPSPEQAVRIRLTLGEKLLAESRDTEAYENYQQLMTEAPDYPGKTAIYQKLLSLAQKLGKTGDATKYQALQP
jgi:tetratricopeptide (TPR) repeat protein